MLKSSVERAAIAALVAGFSGVASVVTLSGSLDIGSDGVTLQCNATVTCNATFSSAGAITKILFFDKS